MTKNLAVVGSPIAHSKSPQIHTAAYRVLGNDWHYTALEITEGRLLQFVETLDESWIGLSVTMPLKLEATRIADSLDDIAVMTGITNTLLRGDKGWRGFNTDVGGIQKTLQSEFSAPSPKVTILGSGATAVSAAFAALLSNPKCQVTLVSRNRKSSVALNDLLSRHGFRSRSRSMGAMGRALSRADIVISTLPSGALDAYVSKVGQNRFLKPKGVFLDVAYQQRPSKFGSAWQANSLKAISGIEMLIQQAIIQVRIFTSGDPTKELANERAVELAMRDSQGLI